LAPTPQLGEKKMTKPDIEIIVISNKMEVGVNNQKALFKVKVNVNVKNNSNKIGNLKVTRKCGLISNVKFKRKVKELLNL